MKTLHSFDSSTTVHSTRAEIMKEFSFTLPLGREKNIASSCISEE
jgi:hypothetical protein